MRNFLLFIFLLARAPGQGADEKINLPPRQVVPQAVRAEAKVAAQKLVDEVVRGNLGATIERMNPAWKKKEALKHGGVEKYLAILRKSIAKQQAAGVKIVAMAADPAHTALEVDFGVVQRGNARVGVYKQWMVLVPTRKIVTAFDRNAEPPRLVKMGLNGFMVALKKKSGGEWTFIDGSALHPADLRKIFPFMPKGERGIDFPPRNGRVMDEK